MATQRTETVTARELRIDDIVVDEDGEHEITCIDLPTMGESYMGVTMHGEEEGGEFCYRVDETVTRYAR